MQHFLSDGDLVTARAGSKTLLPRGRQTSSPSDSVFRGPRFATSTSRLGGGLCDLRDRDCGRKGDIVQSELRHGGPKGQQCKLSRFGRGVCQTECRKVHVREDPECRLHGIAGRMNVRAPQPHPAQPPPAPIAARRDATTPLQPPPATTAAGGECKRILGQQDPVPHQGGLHLLYEPTAEDKWISRQIATCEEGGYKDAQTGKPQQRRRGKLRALPAALLRTLQSGGAS